MSSTDMLVIALKEFGSKFLNLINEDPLKLKMGREPSATKLLFERKLISQVNSMLAPK
jgi:hypothetical protein